VRTGFTVEHGFDVRRPRGDVFVFLSDRERLPAWTSGIKRVRRISTGLGGVGTTYAVVGKMLGRRVEARYEVTAYEPDLTYAGRMVAPSFTFEETYRLEDTPDGTRVHLQARSLPKGRLRLLGPLLGMGIQRQVHADHKRLRTLLERSRPRPAEAVEVAEGVEPAEPPEGTDTNAPVTGA
jgi:carbon monoxide dehydrogenase subunit G